MREHTPGPWGVTKLLPVSDEADYPGAEISWLEVEDDGSTHPHDGAVQIWSVRAEANAALISAAPELLAACEAVLWWQERVGGFSQREDERDVLEPLLAAVAKAKGKPSLADTPDEYRRDK